MRTRKLDILIRVCPKFEPKWLKMPKIESFPHFFENRISDFPNFCMNASLRDCKKRDVFVFSGKLENWTFWAESVKNWHFYGFLGVPRNGCFSLSLRCTRVGPRMTTCSSSAVHFRCSSWAFRWARKRSLIFLFGLE